MGVHSDKIVTILPNALHLESADFHRSPHEKNMTVLPTEWDLWHVPPLCDMRATSEKEIRISGT